MSEFWKIFKIIIHLKHTTEKFVYEPGIQSGFLVKMAAYLWASGINTNSILDMPSSKGLLKYVSFPMPTLNHLDRIEINYL